MLIALILIACGGSSAPAPAPEPAPVEAPAPAPAEAPAPAAGRRVFFVQPSDGAKVKSPVKIEMGIEGMEVRPAGTDEPNSGHHHLIIGPAGIAEGVVVPADEKHIHFGKGQTSTEVELKPGQHQLTLQFADKDHKSFGEPLATTITITVE